MLKRIADFLQLNLAREFACSNVDFANQLIFFPSAITLFSEWKLCYICYVSSLPLTICNTGWINGIGVNMFRCLWYSVQIMTISSSTAKKEDSTCPYILLVVTGAEGPLILFVCGYTWSAIRMCLMHGPRRYFNDMWNWAEIIMLTLFILTFAFWICAAIEVAATDNDLGTFLPSMNF